MIGALNNSSSLPLRRATNSPLEEVGPAAAPTQLDTLADPLSLHLPDHQGDVHGHKASDPRHALYESTHYPLRTYMLTKDQQVTAVDFRELYQGLKMRAYPSKRYQVSAKKLDQVVDRAQQDRDRRAKDLDHLPPGLRATPKDSSLNPTTLTMFTNDLAEVSGVYAQQLAKIGQIEGFQVMLASQPQAAKTIQKELAELKVKNISFMTIPQGEVWVEDYGEPLLQKGWVTPAIFEGDWLRTAISEGREQRFPQNVPTDFPQLGQVHASRLQPAAMAKAAASGGVAVEAVSYLEGGNLLTGTRANGTPYALVGRDSLAITRRLVGDVDDAQVLKVVAADLGLTPAQVFPMEQPGEFHLDMRMMPVAPGEVALNDAKAAAEQQIQWLKAELDKSPGEEARQTFQQRSQGLRAEAKTRALYEELTQRDLEAAGIKVHRMPGVFVDPDSPTVDTSNFFNARHGVNEQGERFSIFMGGKPEEEAFVAEKLLKDYGTRISRLHFLDPTQTADTLSLQGGLKCRTKPDGVLVPAGQLARPAQARLSA